MRFKNRWDARQKTIAAALGPDEKYRFYFHRHTVWQRPHTDCGACIKIDARGYGNKKLMIEPGRSLVGNAGVCVTEVLYLKPGAEKNFCIIDAAMNDLPRPAMYQAFHSIVPVHINGQDASSATYDVVGPVCESGDWIGRERTLSVLAGDHLAVLSAGAYCMSMSSNYNTRGRAAEVLVDGTAMHLIRARETVQDQMRQEQLVIGH